MSKQQHRSLTEIDADIAREEAACKAALANRKEAQARKAALGAVQDAVIAGSNDVLRSCRARLKQLAAERVRAERDHTT